MASQRASLSVPPTQNTAPVIKFQCLFTHDIKRKAKRWQDGFLRFHTFNKRVMVYDSSGNLVGDLHWRDRDMLQDGDEFELERGVMVQAGEQLESTVTDLTGLLDKRKPSPKKPSQTQTYQSSSNNERTNDFRTPYPSSGRLKSLNEVLGIKKNTPAARVVRSPYEERARMNQSMRASDGIERPTKKRKPSPVCDLEESRPPSPSVSPPPPPPPGPARRSPPPERGIFKATRTPREGPPNDTHQRTTHPPVRTSGGVKDLCDKTSNPRQSNFASASNASFRPASTVEVEPTPSKDRRKKSSSKTSSNQQSLTTMFGNLPTTTLEVAPRQPRKKLIFVDRLAEQEAKSIEKRKAAENATLTADLSRRPDKPKPSSALTPRDKNINSYQSTAQFLKDDDNDSEAPHASPQKSTNLLGFFKPATVAARQSDGQHNEGDATMRESKCPTPKRNSTVIQRSLSATDPIIQETSESAPVPEETTLQAGPSEDHPRTLQSERNAPPERSVLDPSALKPPQPVVKKRSVQTKFFPDRIIPPPVDEPEEEVEQGPWTTEALDLFDWWPPGRPKPAAVSVP
ncbi:uncharacterized protein GIQ15_05259 [Arthroderma uncinatum]|uniref:uncharacterized protein n=1 Tax=Arthroderma uncinatum TaxID=74035 RepID=UPI00144AD5C2|nr:uncharacterized protein GIQ15_05259 [Arthroderma uncinatum]KAF3482500.1 hypothetical protein GIQ15_05259 [Arthroderma uncinatum]